MILDTNALSANADGDASIGSVVMAARGIEIPVVVLGEYRYGLAHSSRRIEHEEWLERFIADCRVLDITEETSRVYAEIRSQLRTTGTPIPANDIWIAALARQHGLAVLSRDAHFDRVPGIDRVSW